MTVRINKSAFNIREKLSELERPIGLKGSELMRAETAQEARDFVSAGRKNLIINGDFKIWQRGPEVEVESYERAICADMWRIYGLTGGAKATATRVTDVPANQGFTYALQFEHSVDGVQSSTNNELVANIEVNDPNTSMAPFIGNSTYTLSYWAKTDNPAAVRCSRVRFAATVNSGTQNVSYTQITNHTGSGNWEKLEVRITMFDDADFTTYPFTALRIYFGRGNYTGQHLFTGVQLEVGKNATEFEHRSYGEELALCQRYCYVISQEGNSPFDGYTMLCRGHTYSSSNIYGYMMLPVPMRVPPSFSNLGSNSTPLRWGDWNASSVTGLTINELYGWNHLGGRIRLDKTNAFTAQRVGLIWFDGSLSGQKIAFNAEL